MSFKFGKGGMSPFATLASNFLNISFNLAQLYKINEAPEFKNYFNKLINNNFKHFYLY